MKYLLLITFIFTTILVQAQFGIQAGVGLGANTAKKNQYTTFPSFSLGYLKLGKKKNGLRLNAAYLKRKFLIKSSWFPIVDGKDFYKVYEHRIAISCHYHFNIPVKNSTKLSSYLDLGGSYLVTDISTEDALIEYPYGLNLQEFQFIPSARFGIQYRINNNHLFLEIGYGIVRLNTGITFNIN